MATNEEHIEELLKEFSNQRNELKKMVDELDVLRKKIDNIFPEKLDQRYTRFFEEKIKTATEMFKAVLDLRKEINKSLKDEIELRRKINFDNEEDGDIIDQIDVFSIAKKLKDFNKKKEVLLEKAQGE